MRHRSRTGIARRELLGQPSQEKPAGPARLSREQVCEPGTLSELILNVLVRNAKNIRNLARTEKITVVVTFDGLGGVAKDRQTLGSPQSKRPPRSTSVPEARIGFSPEEAKLLTLAIST